MARLESAKERIELCRRYGLSGEVEAYHFIVSCIKGGIERLLAKGVNARILSQLGYEPPGLRKMGCSDEQLARLGFGVATPPPQEHGRVPTEYDEGQAAHLRELVKSGKHASEIKREGWTIFHLKKASVTVPEMERAGFMMDEIVSAHSAAEMRRWGYQIRDLSRYFNGTELRMAGFSSSDMRNAGYTIRDLMQFGYNENHIKTAGYSINELSREGFTKTTVDRSKFQ